jgi:hypothetical protein
MQFSSRVVFGAEPSDAELFEFFYKNFNHLLFSDSLTISLHETIPQNPKLRQREISKELHNRTGTRKSWEAVKLFEQQQKNSKKGR